MEEGSRNAIEMLTHVSEIYQATARLVGGLNNFPQEATKLLLTEPDPIAINLLYDTYVVWQGDRKVFPTRMLLALTDYAVQNPHNSTRDGRQAAAEVLMKLFGEYDLSHNLCRKIFLKVKSAVHSVPMQENVGDAGNWHGNRALLGPYVNYGFRSCLTEAEWEKIVKFYEDGSGCKVPDEYKEK